MNRLAPQLIIFDCDGVLVDSELIANRILQQGLEELGLSLSLEETLSRYTGRSFQDLVGVVETELSAPVPAGFWRKLQQTTYDRFRQELQPVQGAADLLAGLRLPFCVASSGSEEKIRLSLQVTGLLKWFQDGSRIFSAARVAAGKPAPDLFLHAAAAMDTLPGACLVIEDSVPGVQAGLAAGMITVLLQSGQPVPQLPGMLSIPALSGIRQLLVPYLLE